MEDYYKMVITVIQILFCIWVAINIRTIIHNQRIITNNQNNIFKKLDDEK